MIKLTDQAIDVQEVIDKASSNEAGAVSVFIGTVRNMTDGKPVVKLDFESYEKMALTELQNILEQAKEQWPVQEVAIVHRTGELSISDIAVCIAVSSPHRAEAFEACRFIIDTLKQTVPIWKKEFFEDDEVWVAAHP